jgi:hypothetical protein
MYKDVARWELKLVRKVVSIGNTDKADGIGGFRLVTSTKNGLGTIHYRGNWGIREGDATESMSYELSKTIA